MALIIQPKSAKVFRTRIFRPYFHQEVYAKLLEWMKQTPGTWFDKSAGRSWINNGEYWSVIVCPDSETLLVCKLMFPEIIL